MAIATGSAKPLRVLVGSAYRVYAYQTKLVYAELQTLKEDPRINIYGTVNIACLFIDLLNNLCFLVVFRQPIASSLFWELL